VVVVLLLLLVWTPMRRDLWSAEDAVRRQAEMLDGRHRRRHRGRHRASQGEEQDEEEDVVVRLLLLVW